jgi:hypothetical protein
MIFLLNKPISFISAMIHTFLIQLRTKKSLSLVLFFVGLIIVVLFWMPVLSDGINTHFYKDQSTGIPKYLAMFEDASHRSYMIWDDSVSLPVLYEAYSVRYFIVILYAVFNNMILAMKVGEVCLALFAYTFSFIFVKRLFKDSLIGLYAGLLYSSMLYFLGMVNIHFNSSWFYALLPLGLLTVEMLVEQTKLLYFFVSAAILGIIIFLITMQGPFLLGGFIFLYYLLRIISTKIGEMPFCKLLFMAFLKVAFLGFLSVAFAAFFIIPRLLEYYPYIYPLFLGSFRSGLNQFQQYSPTIWQIITSLPYYELPANGYFTYAQVPWYISSFYIVVIGISFLSLLIIKKYRQITLPLATVSLIGILFTLGTSTKLSIIILTLRNVIPMFDLIRTPSRFLLFSCLAISVLFALGYTRLFQNFLGSLSKPISLGVFIIALFFVVPYLGRLGGTFSMQPYTYITNRYPQLENVRNILGQLEESQAHRILDLSVPVLDSASRGNFYSMGYRFWQNQYEVVERLVKFPNFADRLSELNFGEVIISPEWGIDKVHHPELVNKVRDSIGSDPSFETVYSNRMTVVKILPAKPRLYFATPILDFTGPIVYKIFPNFPDPVRQGVPVLVDPHNMMHQFTQEALDQAPYWVSFDKTDAEDFLALSHPNWLLKMTGSEGKLAQYDYHYSGALTFDSISNNPFFNNSINDLSPLIAETPQRLGVQSSINSDGQKDYYFSFRLYALKPDTITVIIDRTKWNIKLQTDGWQWVHVHTELEKGKHNISLEGENTTVIDSGISAPYGEAQSELLSWKIFQDRTKIVSLKVPLDPGGNISLSLHKGAQQKDWAFLVNTETYSPQWQAKYIGVGNTTVKSVRSSYFVNGFYLPSGKHNIQRVETIYTNSLPRLIGLFITFLFVGLTLIIFLFSLIKKAKKGLPAVSVPQEKKLTISGFMLIFVILLAVLIFQIYHSSIQTPPEIFTRPGTIMSSGQIVEEYRPYGKSLIINVNKDNFRAIP